MRIFMTGATGMVGRALVQRLRRQGHTVDAWVRDVVAARQVLGADVDLLPTDAPEATLGARLGKADAVVHLAGAPIAKRWTAKHRERLHDSRVKTMQRLTAAMRGAESRPRALVSASAVGWYGDRGDERLDETSARGEGFLPELCRAWEAAADEAGELGLRVVKLRTGIVLSSEGGALARLVPATRYGGGTVLGDGRQFMSWIHLDDLLSMYVRAVEDASWSGAYDATAPHPVDHRQFVQRLAKALHRPTWLRIPAPVLRLVLGDMADVLLHSQRVAPRRALAAGFGFEHTELGAALRDVLQPPAGGPTIEAVSSYPEGIPYFERHRPRYRLRQSVTLDAPIDEVFAFFRQAENLGALTPDDMSFEILTPTPIAMRAGTQIEYRIRLGPIPMKWLTKIERWEPGRCFVDAQYAGPYACWYHEHHFEADGDRTHMTDVVWYAPPLGPLGRIANRLFVAGKLRHIFGHRTRAIRRRFGLVGPTRPEPERGSDEPAAAKPHRDDAAA